MEFIDQGAMYGWRIFHSEIFERKRIEYGKQFWRFIIYWSAQRRMILRDPSRKGQKSVGTDITVVFQGDPASDLPRLCVRYQYGNGKIVFIDLECG
jgi:hypothetical protein